MSCTPARLTPQFAALTGLTDDQGTMAVERARHPSMHQPLASMPPPAPDIVDAVLRQRDGHDRQAVATALRQLLGALIQFRNQGMVDSSIIAPLLAVLTAASLPRIAPAIPVVAASVRARLGVAAPDDPRPAPLPVVQPPDPAAQQRAVRAATSFAPWTDEEAQRIANSSRLAGLAWALGVDRPVIRKQVAWALGVDRPVIRKQVAWALDAAAAAICAGAPDLGLRDRVATHPAIPPDLAAEVLVARPDLATPDLLAKVAENPWAAADVIASTPPSPPRSSLTQCARIAERGMPWWMRAVRSPPCGSGLPQSSGRISCLATGVHPPKRRG